MKKNKVMDFFSALGRSLMMPIAALAACGIILGVTAALLKTQVVEAVPFLQQPVVFYILNTLKTVSNVVFTLIPVLFAISISFGMAKEDKEVAAFAGFIGYYTFLVSASCMINSGFMNFDSLQISIILGVETLDMGAVAGILTGVTVAALHNKYHKVVFPVAIAFYGGKRFVAIVVILAMALLGQVAPFIWAPVSAGINGLGTLISESGLLGVFSFGFLERLLIPTGLHHFIYIPFIFGPAVVDGGIQAYWLQHIQEFAQSTKPLIELFPQGGFALHGMSKIFGCPGIALAIYFTAKPERRKKVAAILIPAVITAVLCGITEPLEFTFLFIAPVLFLIHAILAGTLAATMYFFGVTGNFGGGVLDCALFQNWVPLFGIVHIEAKKKICYTKSV